MQKDRIKFCCTEKTKGTYFISELLNIYTKNIFLDQAFMSTYVEDMVFVT